MCFFCEEGHDCPRHGSYNLVLIEDGPETVQEALESALNATAQPSEFVGGAR